MDDATGVPDAADERPLTAVEVSFRSRFKAVFDAYRELSRARETLQKQWLYSAERERIQGFWDSDFSDFFTQRLMVIRDCFHRDGPVQERLFDDELLRLNAYGAEKIGALRELVQEALTSPQIQGSNELPHLFNEIKYKLNDFERAFNDIMGLLNTRVSDLDPARSAA